MSTMWKLGMRSILALGFSGILMFAAGCGNDNNNAPSKTSAGLVTASSTGSVAAGTTVTVPSGVTSLIFASSSVLTDSSGAPVTGSITTTVTQSTSASSLPAAAPAGTVLAVLLDIDMSKGATKVKNFSTPMTVIVAVPTGVTSVNVYSFNGTSWVFEKAGVAVSGGNATFTISHLSMWGCFATITPLAITTASPLPAGTVGTAYSQTLAASGGTSPYTWTVASGSALPAGLTLSLAGVISGIPTTAGTVNTNVTVTDAATGTNTKAISITVNPAAGAALSITTASPLAAGTVGTAYSQTLAASGGTSPYTWTVASGSTLPAGLTLSAGGVISGTPTTAGTVSANFTVTDAAAGTVTKAFSITVNAAVVQPALNTLTPNCVSACHGLPPTTVNNVAGLTSSMPHTTNTLCGICHVIGGWVPGTTTFDMSGVATHNNGTINILAGLPTASCSACHGLPPVSAIHPAVAVKAYVANCGICHPVGPGNPITMGISTHDNGVINFNP